MLVFKCHCGNTGVKRTSNMSKQRELTVEKKIHPSLLPGIEPATFPPRVWRSTNWTITAPMPSFDYAINRILSIQVICYTPVHNAPQRQDVSKMESKLHTSASDHWLQTVSEATNAQQYTRSGQLRTQNLKSHLMRTQSLRVLPLNLGVGQYVTIHATLTAGISSSLISILPVHSPAFFSKTSPEFFPCWLWLTPVPAWARRMK